MSAPYDVPSSALTHPLVTGCQVIEHAMQCVPEQKDDAKSPHKTKEGDAYPGTSQPVSVPPVISNTAVIGVMGLVEFAAEEEGAGLDGE